MSADDLRTVESLEGRVRELERALAESRARVEEQEQMLRAGFATTLVSKELGRLGAEELDAGIERALASFGGQIGAETGMVCLYSSDERALEITHAWPSGPPLDARPAGGLPLAAFAWSDAQIRALESVHLPRLADLPPEAAAERALCEQGGLRSALFVPLVHRGVAIGFLAFARLSEERGWSEAELALARLVADRFAQAIERRRASLEWGRLFDCMRAFGAEPRANIDRLTALAGELLGGTCALYSRLESGQLCAWGRWQTPPDLVEVDLPDGHICSDVIVDPSDAIRVLRDLQASPYAKSDRNVAAYGLRTYVGRAVSVDGAHVGSLCVVFQRDFEPSPDQRRLFEAVADTIGVEEVRRRAQEALRETASVLEATLDSTADGILVADVQARPLRQNRRFRQMWHTPAAIADDPDASALHRLQLVRDPFAFMTKVAALYADETHDDFSTFELVDGRTFERYSVPLRVDGQLRGRVWSFRDVTEQARRDEELRHGNALLEATLESTADGILVADERGLPLRENGRLREMWRVAGRVEDAALGREERARRRLALVKEPEVFVRGLLELYADQTRERFTTVELKDGRVFERYSIPLRVGGEPRGRVTSYRDVTERSRRDAELRNTLALLEGTLEATADGILVADPLGRPLRYNRHFLEVWRVPPEYRDEREPLDAAAWAVDQMRGSASALAEWSALCADPDAREFTRLELADRRVIERYSIPLRAFGAHLGRVFSFRDVSERARAEAARSLLATAVEQAGEGVLITDREGRIEYVNPTFERISGYPLDALRGRTPRVLKSGRHGDDTYRALWEAIREGNAWSGRLVNRRADGTLYEVFEVIAPVRTPDGAISSFVGILRDVTREHQLEEEVRQAQKMEAVGRLAGGIAHDFNNLLTAIIGYTEMVEERLRPGDRLAGDVHEIRVAAERAANLTRQLLAFGRRQLLQPRVLDVNEVLRGMEKLLRRLIPENVAIRSALGVELGAVRADPGQLEQVVLNLVLNARDAMVGAGTIDLATAAITLEHPALIGHDAIQPGRYVRLSVADDGRGMDAATLARIFEPFFTTKGVGEGTGLGLATVYGIVRQSGGAIQVESRPGAGTRFEITLPVCDAEEAPVERPSRVGRSARARTILLVEDEPAVRAIAVKVLRGSGYRVLEAADGVAALAVMGADAAGIDALVTDVVMPRMSGPELAQRVCAAHPSMPVLFTSGHVDASVAGLELPADAAFLPKPFEPEALRRAVHDLLLAHDR